MKVGNAKPEAVLPSTIPGDISEEL